MATTAPCGEKSSKDAAPAGFLRWLAEPLKKLTRREILGLVLLLLLALALRMHGLNKEPLDPTSAEDVFVIDSSTFGGILSGKQVLFGHPPLYYILLKGWIGVFGRSMTAFRLSSVLTGTLSVGLVWLLTLRAFGKKTAFTAAALAGLSFVHISYSQPPRAYIFQYLVAVSSLVVLFYLLEKQSRGALALYAVVNAVGLWSHYFYAYTLMTHMLIVLLEGRTRGTRLRLLASTLLSWVLFLPWAFKLLSEWQMRYYVFSWSPNPFDFFSLRTLWVLFVEFIAIKHPERSELFFPQLIYIAIVALVLLGVACFRSAKDRNLRVVFFFSFVPLLAFNIAELFLGPMIPQHDFVITGYFISSLAGIHLTLSHTIATFKKPLSAFLLLLFLVPSLGLFYLNDSLRMQTDWRSAANHLTTFHSPNATMVFIPYFNYYYISHWLPKEWPHTFRELRNGSYDIHLLRHENTLPLEVLWLISREEPDIFETSQYLLSETRPEEFVLVTDRFLFEQFYSNVLGREFVEGAPLGDYELVNATWFPLGSIYVNHYRLVEHSSPRSP